MTAAQVSGLLAKTAKAAELLFACQRPRIVEAAIIFLPSPIGQENGRQKNS
jgi:hypothetical protein